MSVPLPDILPAETLFLYLSDVPVLETISDDARTSYMFQCGCIAKRKVSQWNVRVIWCEQHYPQLAG
jgi:hypothetical protein